MTENTIIGPEERKKKLEDVASYLLVIENGKYKNFYMFKKMDEEIFNPMITRLEVVAEMLKIKFNSADSEGYQVAVDLLKQYASEMSLDSTEAEDKAKLEKATKATDDFVEAVTVISTAYEMGVPFQTTKDYENLIMSSMQFDVDPNDESHEAMIRQFSAEERQQYGLFLTNLKKIIYEKRSENEKQNTELSM